MSPDNRLIARRQLDKRLSDLRHVDEAFARPQRGWVKAIREALGMTTTQLAARLGVNQSRIVRLESAEAKKGITLESLERAAHALDCQLVYALVPRKSLSDIVNEQARKVAKARLVTTKHTMALEAQSVTEADNTEQLERLAKALAEKSPSSLWDEV